MIITENGDYPVKPSAVRTLANGNKETFYPKTNAGGYITYISGTFGTGTFNLGYVDELGVFVVLENSPLVVNTQNPLRMGDMEIILRVANVDGTTNVAFEIRGE